MSALVNKFALGDKTTTLTSPLLVAGSQCLIFYYYAYGEVTLQITYAAKDGTSEKLKSYTGSKDHTWRKASIALPSNKKDYKV